MTVLRGKNVEKEINSVELVPGDVIVVKDSMNLPCDLLLLSGSCIVNESMLTGESIPIFKNSISESAQLFDFNDSYKHILRGGTVVEKTRSHN